MLSEYTLSMSSTCNLTCRGGVWLRERDVQYFDYTNVLCTTVACQYCNATYCSPMFHILACTVKNHDSASLIIFMNNKLANLHNSSCKIKTLAISPDTCK